MGLSGVRARGGPGMVQEAAAPLLSSPIQGRQGSHSSMWPVVALGILTAIFAWFWYRGSGERREPGTPVQREDSAVTAETEEQSSRAEEASPAPGEQPSPRTSPVPAGESSLPTADPWEASEHGAPCPKITEEGLSSDTFNESEEKDPSDEGDREVQNHVMAAANPPGSEEEEVGAADQPSDGARGEQDPTEPKEALQGHLTTGAPQEPRQAEPQAHRTSVNEGKKLPEDGAQPNAEGCPGNDPHSSGAMPSDEEQEDGEDGLPTVMAAGAPGDPCDAGLSDQRSAQGERHGNERVNADEEAGNGTGGQLENSFCVKENARNVLESEETLMQDPYLEVNLSSDIECTIVTDQFIEDESVEKFDLKTVSKCNDIVKPSILQENADFFDNSLTKSTPEALCDFQKLGTCSEGSSMEIYSMYNQEKGMSGLCSSNTEKNSLSSSSEANVNEADNQKTKKVATIQPMPQNVNFGFKVHYITHSDSQFIAVTGDHETLGKWETYIPLTSGTGGFWSHSITLPADTNVAWKFIMVENGKIKRWEECNNRLLKITHEDIEGHLFWGYP